MDKSRSAHLKTVGALLKLSNELKVQDGDEFFFLDEINTALEKVLPEIFEKMLTQQEQIEEAHLKVVEQLKRQIK